MLSIGPVKGKERERILASFHLENCTIPIVTAKLCYPIDGAVAQTNQRAERRAAVSVMELRNIGEAARGRQAKNRARTVSGRSGCAIEVSIGSQNEWGNRV